MIKAKKAELYQTAKDASKTTSILNSKNSISKTCNKEIVKSVLDTSLLTPLGHLVNNVYPLLTFKFQIPTIYSAILC